VTTERRGQNGLWREVGEKLSEYERLRIPLHYAPVVLIVKLGRRHLWTNDRRRGAFDVRAQRRARGDG
jgi:hypothetical protein